MDPLRHATRLTGSPARSHEAEIVLLTGGSVGDMPMLRAAKRMGLLVVTSGNKPSDPAHEESDLYVEADYRDAERLGLVARGLGVKAIVPSCHDLAASTVEEVARREHLVSPYAFGAVRAAARKDLLKDLLIGGGIPVAGRIALDDVAATLKKPGAGRLVVKPVDLAGGRGVKVCTNEHEARDAIRAAVALSPSGLALAEEFVDGSMHGVSLFVWRGRPVALIIDDEFFRPNSARVAATRFPSSLGSAERSEIGRLAVQVAELLEVQSGLVHLQVTWGSGPVVLEVSLRPPGDWYQEFAYLATGFDFTAATLASYLGVKSLKGLLRPRRAAPSALLRWVGVAPTAGGFAGCSNSLRLTDGSEFELLYARSLGTRADEMGTSTMAIAIVRSETPNLLPSFDEAEAALSVIMEP